MPGWTVIVGISGYSVSATSSFRKHDKLCSLVGFFLISTIETYGSHWFFKKCNEIRVSEPINAHVFNYHIQMHFFQSSSFLSSSRMSRFQLRNVAYVSTVYNPSNSRQFCNVFMKYLCKWRLKQISTYDNHYSVLNSHFYQKICLNEKHHTSW